MTADQIFALIALFKEGLITQDEVREILEANEVIKKKGVTK